MVIYFCGGRGEIRKNPTLKLDIILFVQALYYLFGLWALIVRLGIWMCGYLQERRYSVNLFLIVVVLMVLAEPLY